MKRKVHDTNKLVKQFQNKLNHMNKKILLLLCALLLSCSASQKNGVTTVTLTSECPKNGTCTLKLHKNKSMSVKTDEWGNRSYALEESTEKSVIQFNYVRTVKGNIQDAGYREEIAFEINNGNYNLSQSGAALQNTKMLFGRFCFCKGQTGYYNVIDGKLTISGSKEKTAIINFKVAEVPQIINGITFTLK
jgi:hypothetical protein